MKFLGRRLFFSCLAVIATAGAAEGALPDRIQLSVDKGSAGNLELGWQDACSKSGTDYAVFEGDLAVADSHTWLQCGTAGTTTATVSPGAGNTYYLVVPLEDGAEGSYGVKSDGTERAVGTGTCLAQSVVAHCLEDNFVTASPERVARLDTVLSQAAAIIESGGTYTQVATMLAGESDVAGVYSNGVSMYFSVGGLSTTIFDTIAARRAGPMREIIPPSNPAPLPTGSLASNPIPASAVEPLLPRGQRMVGEDDDGDGFRDLPKHALVLSPWAFDFTPNDSAPIVRDILNGVRDYQEGSVTFKDNTTDLLTDTMLLSDYTSGWDDKDIIFISSHGEADANAVWGPAPYLFLGIGGATCADTRIKLLSEGPDPALLSGLHCSLPIEIGPGPNPITGIDTLGTRAFWEAAHGGNLDKKLIYFDACRTSIHPGLAEALIGTDSIFLGWSELVDPVVSTASANAVIRETVEDAFPVLRSFVHECGGGACIDPPSGSFAQAELLGAWHRADLRTREALSIPATPIYGFCGESGTQPVHLTCPSCGGDAPMSMNFGITIEGIEPEDLVQIQDPLEFGKYQLRLFADVDDVESGYAWPLIDAYLVSAGNGIYTDAFGFTLYMDNICPHQIIEYNPWALLPTFDENMPGNDARDRINSWGGPFTIEIVPVQLP